MKTLLKILLPLLAASVAQAQDRPWQQLQDPTAAQAATDFKDPPPEYSSQFTWGWAGNVTKDVIDRDLDTMKSLNVRAVWIEPGRSATATYLTPDYFNMMKVAVQEAKTRDMRIWVDDDGGYPSGFAGGKFTLDRPDLRMKALDASQQVPVTTGSTFSRQLDDTTICALAYNRDSNTWQTLTPVNGQVNWTVPAGNWTVVLPRWSFKSGPTKSATNTSGAKDNEHSLADYLSPEAGKLFTQWTMGSYKDAVGDEFGKVFLGFRGDEAAFGFNPWTPDLPAEFLKRKGYDIRPWLPAIAAIRIGVSAGQSRIAPQTTSLDPAHRAFADYCDVWSSLMAENFFDAEADWCAANNLEMQIHIEHEEILPQMAIADGDYFKAMSHMGMPGIDTIWNQIWPGTVNDFPKLASSAAHLNGRPHAMIEALAAYNPQPDITQARWIMNEVLALGITHVEWMFWPASTSGPRPPRGLYGDPGFPTLAAFVNRASYLLGEGKPAAQIGVYIPSSSFWFGDTQANDDFKNVVHQLLQDQRDLDYVDEGALSGGLVRQGGAFINKSGQAYRAIIVPPVDAISKASLDNLHAFAQAGGKVIFLGHAPTMVMDKNFLTATGPADISWAMLEPKVEITPAVLAALPAPDVALSQADADIRYNHRQLKDADVYFFFNESDQPADLTATVGTAAGAQSAQAWDGDTGAVAAYPGASFANGKATLPLKLAPGEGRLIVLGGGAPVASNN